MTNDEIPNDESSRKLRHSEFVIPSSLGISSFVIPRNGYPWASADFMINSP